MKHADYASTCPRALPVFGPRRDRGTPGPVLALAVGLLAGGLLPVRAAPMDLMVTVESLAPANGTLVAPVWIGFHDGTFDGFDAGGMASAALESLAEDGDAAPLDAAFQGSGSGQVSGVIASEGALPPFAPGSHASMRFRLDSALPTSRYLSYAAMVVPSNDAFIGNDDPRAIPVFDEAGRFVGGSLVVAGTEVWDAGTEVNDELPMNTAFLGQAAANTGSTEGSGVGVHPGFHPAGSGGILDGSFNGFSFSGADFKQPGYQVVRITITRVMPVTVTIENVGPTHGTLFSPVWVGFHDGAFDAFDQGAAAGSALERLAEDGNATLLSDAFQAGGHGSVEATLQSGGEIPPFASGERMSHTFWLDPDKSGSRYFSYAAMVVPSNDAFMGNDDPMRHPVFDAEGHFVGGSFTVMGGQVWDAGTEVNDELPMNTAFLGQATPNTGANEGGVVMPHPGFKAPGMGGIRDGSFNGFTFADADLKDPGYRVARITLSVGPVITGLQLGQGMARITWVGGEGPFTIQTRPSLVTGAWQDVLTTTEHLAEPPVEGALGFFRVVGP
ncbi:MAG: spondin domain-containing protein [Verrucomicrobiales bacterium]|nr:spondin domain-containing protein [Verrucomicrobiales bacterium]